MHAKELAEAASRRLAERQGLLQRCRKRPARDAVHRLRVQTRRLLAELALLAPCLPARELKAARRTLKRQLHAASGLRDLQVQLETVSALQAHHAGLASFRRHLLGRERRTAAAMAARLKRRKSTRKLAALDLELKELAGGQDRLGQGGEPGLRRTLQQAFARVLRIERLAASDPRRLHRLRIALKRYRYLAEALPPGTCPLTIGQMRCVRVAQGRLGGIQDLMLLERRLRRYARRHPPGVQFRSTLDLLAQRRARREFRQRQFTAAKVRTLAPGFTRRGPMRKLR